MTDIYTENGYTSRDDYLRCVAEEHGVALETVEFLASVLGATEDFDGLVNAVQEVKENS